MPLTPNELYSDAAKYPVASSSSSMWKKSSGPTVIWTTSAP